MLEPLGESLQPHSRLRRPNRSTSHSPTQGRTKDCTGSFLLTLQISSEQDGLRRQGRGTPPYHPASILLCSGDLLEALTVRSPCWRHARASCGRGAGRGLPQTDRSPPSRRQRVTPLQSGGIWDSKYFTRAGRTSSAGSRHAPLPPRINVFLGFDHQNFRGS